MLLLFWRAIVIIHDCTVNKFYCCCSIQCKFLASALVSRLPGAFITAFAGLEAGWCREPPCRCRPLAGRWQYWSGIPLPSAGKLWKGAEFKGKRLRFSAGPARRLGRKNTTDFSCWPLILKPVNDNSLLSFYAQSLSLLLSLTCRAV